MPKNHNKKKNSKKPIVLVYGTPLNTHFNQQFATYQAAEEAKAEEAKKTVRFNLTTCRDFAADLARLQRKEGLTEAQYEAWERNRDLSRS